MEASIQQQEIVGTPDLLSTLRQREAQVELLRAAYSAAMARDGMSWWIATAASELREAKGRKMVHIGAELSMAESAISRFERHINFPRDIDTTVAGYAKDLDVEPIDLWTRALELWRLDLLANGAASPEKIERLERALGEAAQATRRSRAQRARGKRAQGRSDASGEGGTG